MRIGLIAMVTTVLASALLTGQVSAEPTNNTRVMAIQEATAKANCKLVVDGKNISCPVGTVVWADEMSYQEAKVAGIKDYVVIGKDKALNDARTNEKVGQVREHYVAQRRAGIRTMASLAGCTGASRTINGTYSFSTNTPDRPTIQYILTYYRGSDCGIYNVRDESRRSAGTGIAQWTTSCTNALNTSNGQCMIINLYLNSQYTAEQWEIDSYVGQRYRNNNKSGNHYAYGWWDFD